MLRRATASAGYVTIDGVNYDEIWYGVTLPAIDQYKEVQLPVLNALAMPHDITIFPYFLSDRMGFQPLAKGQRPDMRKLDEAWIQPTYSKWGVGNGTDRDTLAIAPSRHIIAAINRVFKEDPEEVLKRMLTVMMTKPGALNSTYGFWSGTYAAEENITKPPTFQQNSFLAAHSHYIATNNASLTLPFISGLKTHIREHGHSGPLAGFIDSVTRERFENIVQVTAGITRSTVSDAVILDGFQDQFHLLGIDWYVTEMMPTDYGLVVQISGEDEFGRPLIMFEPPTLQGLQLHPGTDALHPLIESYFDRWAGWKVFQRGAGVAFQIVASTTYTSPTFV